MLPVPSCEPYPVGMVTPCFRVAHKPSWPPSALHESHLSLVQVRLPEAAVLPGSTSFLPTLLGPLPLAPSPVLLQDSFVKTAGTLVLLNPAGNVCPYPTRVRHPCIKLSAPLCPAHPPASSLILPCQPLPRTLTCGAPQGALFHFLNFS